MCTVLIMYTYRPVGGRVTWEDVGGLSEAKHALLEVFQQPVRYRRLFQVRDTLLVLTDK